MTAESEQRRWQSLLEHGSDMIVVLDRDGVITYLSRSATRWLGYEPGQLIGQPMLKVVHPDDRNRIAGRLAELVEGSALTFSAEYRLGHVDGSWRWTQGLATNLLAQSDLHAVVVNYHDLTERVSAEESLRESQRALTALLGNLPGMVYRCRLDADWTMEFVSQGCADLTGYQPADLIDNRLVAYADLIHPEDREPVWLAVDAAIQADRPYRLEYRIRTARGEDRWVWEQGSAVRGPHGSVVALEGFITDVTERVRTADALRETEAQYRAIFEASSDGLDVTDVATGLVVEANPAFCRMLGYTHQELVGKPASSFIHPDDQHLFGEYLATVKAGGEFRSRARNVRKDGSVFQVEVVGKPFLYQGRIHVLGVIRDITNQLEAERVLEDRVQARTRELSALYRADETLYRSLRLEDILQALVDEATELLEADKGTVLVWDAPHERLIPGASLGFSPESLARMSHRPGEGITGTVAQTGAPIAVEDVAQDPRVARYITDPEQIRSLLHVPITVGDEIFGVFGMNYCRPRQFSGDEVRLLTALAQRAALAINNARLYERTEQRSREIEGLYRADAALHASLKVDHVLQALVDVATDLLQVDKTAVLVWDEPHERLIARIGRGFNPETLERMVHGPGSSITWLVAESGAPVVVNDVWKDARVARHLADAEGIRSLLQVPITIGGEVFGVFGVNHCKLHTFTADEQRVLASLAQRAALAIENARLYEQAEGRAALEERQKLARELHDSVSQALYGIALGARTARTLLDRDPGKATEPLDYVLGLSEAGLAEMRALIFELRPESLAQEGLLAALQKHAASLKARHGLAVELSAEQEPDLPLVHKEALYRVAQEASHNITKHAHASRVDIRLTCDDAGVVLAIEDDGAGFDTAASFPGHLGLKSMRERMERIGGELTLASSPGCGTRIQALLRAAVSEQRTTPPTR